MRMMIALLGVSLLTSTAFAQVSVDEAKARLAERRAHATTQPAETVDSLTAEVSQLKAENAMLKAKVVGLEKKLAAGSSSSPVASGGAVDPETFTYNGKALAEVEKALGKFQRVSVSDDVQTYRLMIPATLDIKTHVQTPTITIELSVKDGVVEHSDVSKENGNFAPPNPAVTRRR